MRKRNRTGEILEIKERSSEYFGLVSYNLKQLLAEWKSESTKSECNSDFYVVRAVTILEVFTRRRLAALVNYDKRFAATAAALMKDYKIDFEVLQSIHGRTVTLGDIVGHSVPVNSFSQMISHFETLLDKPLRPLLSAVIDRLLTEIKKLPPEPIIPDYDLMAKTVARLFEVRHIVCHELPAKPAYARAEVDGFLTEATGFVMAFENVLSFELYGNTPLTQSEMNMDSANRLREKEQELERFLAAIPTDVKLVEGERDALLESQKKWLSFRNAQCDFEAFLNKGGTIWSLIWSSNARSLTEDRLKELKHWIEHRSNL